MSLLVRPAIRSGLPADPEFNLLVCKVSEDLEAGHPVDLVALRATRPEHADRLERLLPTLEAMATLCQSGAKDQFTVNGSISAADLKPVADALGEFRILREIGRGGMGIVYEAEQIPLSRRVALKVLPFASMLSEVQLQRFKNEARAAAALKHPHIVSIFSVGCDHGVHYYAMQLVEGYSLAELIQQLRSCSGMQSNATARTAERPDDFNSISYGNQQNGATSNGRSVISPNSDPDSPDYFRGIACLGIDAAEALDHAHQHGVLHRDVKPANLLLDHAGQLWITDFGLASTEADGGLTMTGDLVGTLRYMSSEQVTAQGVMDRRTDVYSLGVTLYELATLEPAFHHGSRGRLLHAIVFGRVPRARSVNPRVPVSLDAIIRKATERNSDKRYQSAADMADDLKRFLNDEPVKVMRRRPWASLVAVMAFGLAVTFAGILIIVRDRQGIEKARFRVEEGEKIEIAQTPVGHDRAVPPPINNNRAQSAGPAPVPGRVDDVVQKVRPAVPASPYVGDPSLAVYVAYGPVDGGSTLVQVNWDGTVRGYIELPFSISGLAPDKGRLLAAIGSSRVGQGRVLSINERGLTQTVFRDKNLLPDTIEIWSSVDSESFLVADNGADIVAAIRKSGAVPPEIKVKLPHTDNFQSMSVAMSNDGSVLFSDSDQNGVYRLSPGSGPTLGNPLLNESGAVASRPGTNIWVAAMDDNLHVFDGDQQIAEMAYPVGMSMLRPNIGFTKSGTLVLGFDTVSRQYVYAVDLEEKQFHRLFTIDVTRLTGLTIAPKMDWTEGDAVQLQRQNGEQPSAETGAGKSNRNGLTESGSDVANKNGRFSLSFDGRDDFVTIPRLTYDGRHPITIELLATPASHANNRQLVLVSNFAAANNQDYGISLFQRGDKYPEPNYVSWAIAYAAESRRSQSLIAAPEAWEMGRMAHISFVADGPRFRFYVDGKLWKHGELVGQPAPSDQPFMIGGHDVLKGFYLGTIDEVRFSKVARYSSDYVPIQRFEPDANTMALYHCDEGRGDMLIDSSGNGHHGEVKGASWVVTE